MGFSNVRIVSIDVDESLDCDIRPEEAAEFLARRKSEVYAESLSKDSILITADTTVVMGNAILNKPENAIKAAQTLNVLSGKTHKVITACCLRTNKAIKSFSQTSIVKFKNLTEEEISYYIQNYAPYDKAGAYGIQEWIGLTGIEKIEGDFYTIMGLPCQKLFEEIKKITSA